MIKRHRTDNKVDKMVFQPRSVILGSMWVENRWVVTVSSETAKTSLVIYGVHVGGKDLRCRVYDDVLGEEYKRFLKKEGEDD